MTSHSLHKVHVCMPVHVLTVSFSISEVSEPKNMAFCNKHGFKWPTSPVYVQERGGREGGRVREEGERRREKETVEFFFNCKKT